MFSLFYCAAPHKQLPDTFHPLAGPAVGRGYGGVEGGSLAWPAHSSPVTSSSYRSWPALRASPGALDEDLGSPAGPALPRQAVGNDLLPPGAKLKIRRDRPSSSQLAVARKVKLTLR